MFLHHFLICFEDISDFSRISWRFFHYNGCWILSSQCYYCEISIFFIHFGNFLMTFFSSSFHFLNLLNPIGVPSYLSFFILRFSKNWLSRILHLEILRICCARSFPLHSTHYLFPVAAPSISQILKFWILLLNLVLLGFVLDWWTRLSSATNLDHEVELGLIVCHFREFEWLSLVELELEILFFAVGSILDSKFGP